MSKLPAILKIVARRDDRAPGTLEQFARVLRHAGLIRAEKRGRGAPHMTVGDVANLLIGANGADYPSHAPSAVMRFRSLRRHLAHVQPAFDVDALRHVAAAPTFGDAIEALIAGFDQVHAAALDYIAAAHDPAAAQMMQPGGTWMPWAAGPVRFDVRLHRYAAEIVGAVSGGGGWREAFRAEFLQAAELIESGFYGRRQSDRRVSVTLDGRLIYELWAALHGDAGAVPEHAAA